MSRQKNTRDRISGKNLKILSEMQILSVMFKD